MADPISIIHSDIILKAAAASIRGCWVLGKVKMLSFFLNKKMVQSTTVVFSPLHKAKWGYLGRFFDNNKTLLKRWVFVPMS